MICRKQKQQMNFQNIFRAFVCCMALLLFLPVSSHSLSTKSGRPEVSIDKDLQDMFLSEVYNEMLNKGYTIKTESTRRIVFEKENIQSRGAKLAVGVLFGGQDSREEVVYNVMVPKSGQTRIMLDVFFIYIDKKDASSRKTTRGQFYEDWQRFLNGIYRSVTGEEPVQKTVHSYQAKNVGHGGAKNNLNNSGKQLPGGTPAIVNSLHDPNFGVRRNAAKEIYKNWGNDPAVLGAVNQELLDLYNSQSNDQYLVDYLSWLCKILGASGDTQYAETLALVAANAPNGKLRRYASSSLNKLQ